MASRGHESGVPVGSRRGICSRQDVGAGGWSMRFFDPEVMGAVISEFAERSEVLLQGRRTYQVSAAAWPGRSGDPFADWINRAQKYVVSDTLADGDLAWRPTTIIRGADLVHTVAALREKPGGDIYVYGSLRSRSRRPGTPRCRSCPSCFRRDRKSVV